VITKATEEGVQLQRFAAASLRAQGHLVSHDRRRREVERLRSRRRRVQAKRSRMKRSG
jgi:hypothetical protein